MIAKDAQDTLIVGLRRKILNGHGARINLAEFGRFIELRRSDIGREFHTFILSRIGADLCRQFLIDASGERLGFEGAIRCLRAYIGKPEASGLLKEAVDDVESRWNAITDAIAKEVS